MARTTILVPRGAEAAAVRRARRTADACGRAAGVRIVEVSAGVNAATALPAFDADETVIVLGLCGALGRLVTGDVAVYARVADAAGTFELDTASASALAAAVTRAWALVPHASGAQRASPTSAVPRASVVSACTVDRVVTTAAARALLAQRFAADVVDMEGTHLAAALAARGVRYAMARVVSDDASRDLPPLEDAIDPQGRVRPLRIARAFARSPRAAFAFARNVRRALAVLTATARAVSDARV